MKPYTSSVVQISSKMLCIICALLILLSFGSCDKPDTETTSPQNESTASAAEQQTAAPESQTSPLYLPPNAGDNQPDTETQSQPVSGGEVQTQASTQNIIMPQTSTSGTQTLQNGIDPITVTDAVFPESEMKQLDSSQLQGFGYNMYSENEAEPEMVYYTGGDIIIYSQLSPRADMPMFMYVMLDGVMQEFVIEYGGVSYKKADHQYICPRGGETTAARIKFTPDFGKQGDTMLVHIVMFIDPMLRLTSRQVSIFAPQHTAPYGCFKLVMNADAPTQNARINKSYPSSAGAIDRLIRENFGEMDMNSNYELLCTNIADTFEDGWTKTRLEVKKSSNTTLSLYLFGDPGEYRVSVFLNREMIPVFDGAYYADFTVKSNMQTKIDFSFNTTGLSEFNEIYLFYHKLTSPADINTAFIKTNTQQLLVN